MPLEVRKDGGILWVVVSSTLTVNDLEQFSVNLRASASIADDIDTIWDFDDFDFSQVNRGILESWIDRDWPYPARRNARIVLVAGSDLGFGMCRMYQLLSEAKGLMPPGQLYVARTTQQALGWLEGAIP